MYERANKRISVGAVFTNSPTTPIYPYQIIWAGRRRDITKVGYIYKFKEGDTTFYMVAVTDDINFYELKFDTQRLTWEMGRIAVNE